MSVLLKARSDYVALRAACRATPGSTDPSKDSDLDLFTFPLDDLVNVRALWNAGFFWERPALEALLDRLFAAGGQACVKAVQASEQESGG